MQKVNYATLMVSFEPFFVKFHTKDEEEAIKLMKCIYGNSVPREFLVAISEDGEIYG